MVGRNLGRKLGLAIKKIQEAFLVDYLKVLLDEVDRVLCLIGVHGVFIDCLVQEAIHKPMVTWLARRKKLRPLRRALLGVLVVPTAWVSV